MVTKEPEMSANSTESKKLRLITYLSPGIPVEVFETYMNYIEEITGCEAYLIYESRWSGPPEGRVDPFTADEVDIAFMESSDYLRLTEQGNKHIELCGAAPVHAHAKNSGKPIYFSDIIINSRNTSKYKELIDLRGHTLGFSSKNSVSASIAMLEHLKKQGFDASFFAHLYESGSHLASIRSVLDSRSDVAAVDSNVLAGFLLQHPHLKDNLTVISSLGPLPIYPVVFNNRLPDKLKGQITEGLLGMKNSTSWSSRLLDYAVTGFSQIDSSLYDLEKDLCASIGNLKMSTTYY